MLATLERLPEILATGDQEDRKRVVRSFLAGVVVDHAKGQAVLRWYRLPRLDHRAVMMVEAVGIEPTSGNPQRQASTPISGLS